MTKQKKYNSITQKTWEKKIAKTALKKNFFHVQAIRMRNTHAINETF